MAGLDHRDRLANFAELNTHPIIELNTLGEVVYLNPVARNEFPDMIEKGLAHPLLQGLQKLILDFLPNQHNEMIIFNREISLADKNFDQQLFVLPNSGIYIFIIDITERNKLRAQALLSDRLATVGTLAAGVAHEVNNPISWILENLRFLKKHTDELKLIVQKLGVIEHEMDDEKKILELNAFFSEMKSQEKIFSFEEMINETLHGAERIRDIVRDLKGFARIDKSEVSTVDVNTVLNTAISMAVPEFKHRARLEKNFTPNLPPLMVNSGKLHQVFLNLIVNAAQAIPEGDIDNNRITISTQLQKGRIRIDISDTGHGIDPATMPKIFDPFFTTKPTTTGSGLGLFITHEVISKFGGEIKVNSLPNVGTTFSVFLPAHQEFAVKKIKQESVSEIKKTKKILVVDDEVSLLKTIERMLDEQYQVTVALGGQAALELFEKKQTHFDVIICDLNMPNVNGADLYRHVLKHRPGDEKLFVFITAGVHTPLMAGFLEKITNPILEKPFTPKQLVSVIEMITHQHDQFVRQ